MISLSLRDIKCFRRINDKVNYIEWIEIPLNAIQLSAFAGLLLGLSSEVL